VLKALTASFGEAPEVKTYGEATRMRITTTYLIDDATEQSEAKVESKLLEGLKPFGVDKSNIMSSEKVGETVSRDIIVLFSDVRLHLRTIQKMAVWFGCSCGLVPRRCHRTFVLPDLRRCVAILIGDHTGFHRGDSYRNELLDDRYRGCV
jgi:hypothetical protein